MGRGKSRTYGSLQATEEAAPFAYDSEESETIAYGEPPIPQGRRWAPLAMVGAAAVMFAAAAWRGTSKQASAAPRVQDVTGFRAAASPVVSPGVSTASGGRALAAPMEMYVMAHGESEMAKVTITHLEDSTDSMVPVMTNMPSPKDVMLTQKGTKLTYTDLSDAIVGRVNLDGSGNEILVAGTTNPAVLAVDKVTGRLYWTAPLDDEETSYVIRTSDADGNDAQVLLHLDNQSKGLHHTNGQLYWTEYDTSVLRRCTLCDGTDTENLIEGLDLPMFIDVHGDDIYMVTGGWGLDNYLVKFTLPNDEGNIVKRLNLATSVPRADGIRFDEENNVVWFDLYYDGTVVALDVQAAVDQGWPDEVPMYHGPGGSTEGVFTTVATGLTYARGFTFTR